MTIWRRFCVAPVSWCIIHHTAFDTNSMKGTKATCSAPCAIKTPAGPSSIRTSSRESYLFSRTPSVKAINTTTSITVLCMAYMELLVIAIMSSSQNAPSHLLMQSVNMKTTTTLGTTTSMKRGTSLKNYRGEQAWQQFTPRIFCKGFAWWCNG